MRIASMRDKSIAAAVRAGEPGYVYVGRPGGRSGVKESPYHNPFKLPPKPTLADRARCLALYEGWLRGHLATCGDYPISSMDFDHQDLWPNTTLVCWCASCTRDPYSDPETHGDGCHADIVAKVWKERNGA